MSANSCPTVSIGVIPARTRQSITHFRMILLALHQSPLLRQDLRRRRNRLRRPHRTALPFRRQPHRVPLARQEYPERGPSVTRASPIPSRHRHQVRAHLVAGSLMHVLSRHAVLGTNATVSPVWHQRRRRHCRALDSATLALPTVGAVPGTAILLPFAARPPHQRRLQPAAGPVMRVRLAVVTDTLVAI